ncbi:MAG: SDR family NAD(P)-dependent oxidoreductase [Deltaproteobacteria bacterium]|nr:SDR family NAD(P)-dependent oxidoreductase [Deltaproteobacteria bacterium]
MKTILITGANRGIGAEVARELTDAGHKVYLGTRDKGLNLKPCSNLGQNATWLTIDASDSKSIKSAYKDLSAREQMLDVLINNAGIYPDGDMTILDIPREQLVETFNTNTFGPVEVIQHFIPLLEKSNEARIINVSSGYGSLEGMSEDVPSYCLSKLTLNGVTIMFSKKLAASNIAVNSVCPGWVRTDMGGPNATRSIEEGALGMVWLATEAPQELTGKFFRDKIEIPW